MARVCGEACCRRGGSVVGLDLGCRGRSRRRLTIRRSPRHLYFCRKGPPGKSLQGTFSTASQSTFGHLETAGCPGSSRRVKTHGRVRVHWHRARRPPRIGVGQSARSPMARRNVVDDARGTVPCAPHRPGRALRRHMPSAGQAGRDAAPMPRAPPVTMAFGRVRQSCCYIPLRSARWADRYRGRGRLVAAAVDRKVRASGPPPVRQRRSGSGGKGDEPGRGSQSPRRHDLRGAAHGECLWPPSGSRHRGPILV